MRSSFACAAVVLVSLHAPAAPTFAQPGGDVVDVVMRFSAADGTPLEAKLSLPADAKGPVPVVFYLHGAGPRTVDNAIQYRDAAGQLGVYKYYDFHAGELARRGVAFFRMSKRGCASEPSGRPTIDRSVFSKAIPSVLLDDYSKALDALRQRSEIDPGRMVLMGSSEGTRLAPQLAARSPKGLLGLVLMSYQSVNQRETVVWQNTVGPWRNVQKLIPAAGDGNLTRAEYDAALKSNPALAKMLPFGSVDSDADGVMTIDELSRVTRARLDFILKALDDRNDDFFWQSLLNLSSGYLLDDWNGEPTSVALLKLTMPVSIFHGDVDGTTSVEGVRETEAAFKRAGRTDVVIRTYPDHDHDLNWTVETAGTGGTAPFQDAFTYAASLLKAQRP